MATNKVILTDGREFVVRTLVKDSMAWEQYAQANGLETMSPVSMTVYQNYSAATPRWAH